MLVCLLRNKVDFDGSLNLKQISDKVCTIIIMNEWPSTQN